MTEKDVKEPERLTQDGDAADQVTQVEPFAEPSEATPEEEQATATEQGKGPLPGEGRLESTGQDAGQAPSNEEATHAAPTSDAAQPAQRAPLASAARHVAMAVAVAAALIVGLLVGAFALNGSASNSALAGKSAVTEQELDQDIASYVVNGTTTTITVREAIEKSSSLEAVKDASGNYSLPSAESVLTVARNKVLVADAEAKGITVADSDITAFAEQQLGTSDLASIAANYRMDEESVKSLLRESSMMNKLRESVMGDTAPAGEAPVAPPEKAASSASSQATAAEAAEGETASDEDQAQTEDEEELAEGEGSTRSEMEGAAGSSGATKEYADYIIKLAGSEWDARTGTWASTDGPYYQALSSYKITPEGATYEAAMAAYYVAYQLYSDQTSATSEVWTNYVNGLLNKASITIYTMLA